MQNLDEPNLETSELQKESDDEHVEDDDVSRQSGETPMVEEELEQGAEEIPEQSVSPVSLLIPTPENPPVISPNANEVHTHFARVSSSGKKGQTRYRCLTCGHSFECSGRKRLIQHIIGYSHIKTQYKTVRSCTRPNLPLQQNLMKLFPRQEREDGRKRRRMNAEGMSSPMMPLPGGVPETFHWGFHQYLNNQHNQGMANFMQQQQQQQQQQQSNLNQNASSSSTTLLKDPSFSSNSDDGTPAKNGFMSSTNSSSNNLVQTNIQSMMNTLMSNTLFNSPLFNNSNNNINNSNNQNVSNTNDNNNNFLQQFQLFQQFQSFRQLQQQQKPIPPPENPLLKQFRHFLANQILFRFLENYQLSPTILDDPVFQELLSAIQLAGSDYHPNSQTVLQDNIVSIALAVNNNNSSVANATIDENNSNINSISNDANEDVANNNDDDNNSHNDSSNSSLDSQH
jgi:transcription elongation factor Elf1